MAESNIQSALTLVHDLRKTPRIENIPSCSYLLLVNLAHAALLIDSWNSWVILYSSRESSERARDSEPITFSASKNAYPLFHCEANLLLAWFRAQSRITEQYSADVRNVIIQMNHNRQSLFTVSYSFQCLVTARQFIRNVHITLI